MRRRLLVLIALALVAGCSRRDRSNPLDPANPNTGGRPAGFNAIAGFTSVALSWTPQPQLAIDGFQLEVQRAGESLFQPLGEVLPANSSAFLDTGEPNGGRVRYRLYYVVHGATANLPAEDEATPGLLRPWVTEFAGSHLTRLSPDARDVVLRVDHLGEVQSLAVSAQTGDVWCSAKFEGLLSLCDPGGDPQLQVTGLQAPYTLAVSPQDNTVWVCDDGGQVLHYASDGSPRQPGSIGLLDHPQGVAVSPRDFSVWVCENAGNRLRHFSSVGAPLSTTDLAGPSRVTVDSLANVTWVTSFSRGMVWRVSPAGAVLDSTAAASGPVGLAVDRVRGRAWIADAAAGRVLALDPSTMGVLFSVNSLPGAWDVAVDTRTGEAWVTVRDLGAVVRISPDGAILDRCVGLADPTEVRLDPGGP